MPLALVVGVVALLVGATAAGAAPSGPAGEPRAGFEIVPLGVSGGLREDDPGATPVRRVDRARWALVDGGTVLTGLVRALPPLAGAVPGEGAQAALGRAHRFLRERVGPVLVTHPHLDHVAGLALGATDDVRRELLGLPSPGCRCS